MTRQYNCILYTTKNGNAPVKRFFDSINAQDRKGLERIFSFIALLKKLGPVITMPHSRVIDHPIYELRPPNYRIFYFFHSQSQSYVIVHAIKKEKGKAPPKDIKVSKDRMNEYNKRHQGD